MTKFVSPALLLSLTMAMACTSTPSEPVAETTTIVTPPAAVETRLPQSLAEAVESPYRTAENKVRDASRHPVETLNFFGLKSDMSVVEVSPGRGWYMEILAPYLSENGRYTAAAVPATKSDYMKKNAEALQAWVAGAKGVKVNFTDFDPPQLVAIAEPESADMVLTFRNVHNWLGNKAEGAAFKAFYKALKPGGVLGVVEHREDPKKKRDPLAKSGYVREADVISMAEKAGFKLDGKSEINANPRDTRNHPKGVWTLPPSFALGDQDREKYAEIGESDRMTLRFIKPVGKAKK